MNGGVYGSVKDCDKISIVKSNMCLKRQSNRFVYFYLFISNSLSDLRALIYMREASEMIYSLASPPSVSILMTIYVFKNK